MDKRIVNEKDLRQPLLDGVEKIASIVKRTLGPGGRPVIIERLGQSLDGSPLPPKLTKDGVSVALECSDPDKVVDAVIQTIKNICKKTNADSGDGTTSAIVLGEAIVNEIEDYLKSNPNENPQLVKESVDRVVKQVVELLKEEAVAIKSNEQIKQVATISANGDTEIGEVIASAFEHAGADGVVTVDEGSGTSVTLEKVDGYQFSRGALLRDAFFNARNLTVFEAEAVKDEGVNIILFDGKILTVGDVLNILYVVSDINMETGIPKKATIPPLVVVANEFSNEALSFMMVQKKELGLQICAVQGPHMSHVRSGYYQDLAAFTGGEVLGNGNRNLANLKAEDIGEVGKVVIDKYKTTFYDGYGTEETVLQRVSELQAAKTHAESPYDAQVINDRIASLTSGIAKIAVGGVTELEIKEKYDRIEDALNAARAAIQEGIVPGGGITLYKISEKLINNYNSENEIAGMHILNKALKAPFRQILTNIGITENDAILEAAYESSKAKGLTYDARHKRVVDSFESGIIDPVKVTRSALENAASIAGLLSTAGGAIIYEKK